MQQQRWAMRGIQSGSAASPREISGSPREEGRSGFTPREVLERGADALRSVQVPAVSGKFSLAFAQMFLGD